MNSNVELSGVYFYEDGSGFSVCEINYEFSKFPGGEIHVKLLEKADRYIITASVCSSDDLMTLLLLNNAIKLSDNHEVDLKLPYIPYAQQDRVCESGEALSVKVMADLINSCNFAKVTVFDPHSHVSTALINNCKVISSTELLHGEEFQSSLTSLIDILIAPDTGAYKKVLDVAKLGNIPVAHATKSRVNGEVQSVTLHGDVKGKNCLVIDDICVGGRTFTELGKAMKDAGANELYLYVSHGIFSKGLDELNEYYSRIYSTNSRPEAVALAKENLISIFNIPTVV